MASVDRPPIEMRLALLTIVTSGADPLSSTLRAVGFIYEDGEPIVYLATGRDGESRALGRLLREVREWDLLLTWGSDTVQFITSRALHHGLDIIPLLEVMHFDLRHYVLVKLGLADKRLEEVASFLHVRSGRRNKSMDVRLRCHKDLILLHGLFKKLRPLLRWTNPELVL